MYYVYTLGYGYNVCAVSYVLPYRPRLTLHYSYIILMMNRCVEGVVVGMHAGERHG